MYGKKTVTPGRWWSLSTSRRRCPGIVWQEPGHGGFVIDRVSSPSWALLHARLVAVRAPRPCSDPGVTCGQRSRPPMGVWVIVSRCACCHSHAATSLVLGRPKAIEEREEAAIVTDCCRTHVAGMSGRFSSTFTASGRVRRCSTLSTRTSPRKRDPANWTVGSPSAGPCDPAGAGRPRASRLGER